MVTIDIHDKILNIIWKSIKDHEESIDPNEPRDFTDKVIMKINQTTDTNSSFYGEKGRENLANTLLDLFVAGENSSYMMNLMEMLRFRNNINHTDLGSVIHDPLS